MGAFSYIFYPWGIILQALAIVHFIRRRPDTYWIFIILFGGAIGALVYLVVEALPDTDSVRVSFKAFPRRRRIRELQAAILDNPSAGNLEELADLLLEEKNYTRAREYYNRAISSRTDSPDPFYRRGICNFQLGDFVAAIPDLERAVMADPKYDFHRAAGLLAHAYAQTGKVDAANALFRQVTEVSTLSETQYYYASFLASQHRDAEARIWAQRILSKRPTMPRFQQRRDRVWFRRTSGLLKNLPT